MLGHLGIEYCSRSGFQNFEVLISDDLKELDAKLRAAQKVHEGHVPEETQTTSSKGWGHGMEFAGGVLGGALLGWFFDRLFGTEPLGLIVFLLLGFAGGLLSVVRSAQKAARKLAQSGNEPVEPTDGTN